MTTDRLRPEVLDMVAPRRDNDPELPSKEREGSSVPKAEIGQLVRLSAKDAFHNEPGDFTPWLAENLDYLADELELDLVLRAKEHPVGPYSLDLLLEDESGRVVIVENQFNKTDHGHLGQLLTYCAGTKAQVVVWIAERMTQEHVAALEWLNDNTIPGTGFFGVELEVLQIGNSPLAPHFRVVVKPNDWTKNVRAETQTAVAQWNWDAYRDFGVDPPKLDVTRHLSQLVDKAVAKRGLEWTVRFNKGYVAYQRPSGYNVVVIAFASSSGPQFKIKLPKPLGELGEKNPFQDLKMGWDDRHREQWWSVPDLNSISTVDVAVEIAARYQPLSGPMQDAEPTNSSN